MALEDAKSIVSAWGAMCGLPFFNLNRGKAVAASLANGLRFELEYLEGQEVFFLYLALGRAEMYAPETLLRRSVALTVGQGVSLGIAAIAGEDSVVAMTRTPVRDVATLNEAVMRLLGATSAVEIADKAPAPGFTVPSGAHAWMSV